VIDNDTLEKIVAGASGSGIAAWIARATGGSPRDGLFITVTGDSRL
jgi:hypothetical protein